jgi:hypothetical protein
LLCVPVVGLLELGLLFLHALGIETFVCRVFSINFARKRRRRIMPLPYHGPYKAPGL